MDTVTTVGLGFAILAMAMAEGNLFLAIGIFCVFVFLSLPVLSFVNALERR